MSNIYRVFLIAFVLLLIPGQSLAATTAQTSGLSTGKFSLNTAAYVPVSYHLDEDQGHLRITFLTYEHFNLGNGLSSTSPLLKNGGRFLLTYSPCVSTYCPSDAYPTMATDLWPGDSTNYLNYKITLNSLDSGATITVTPIN